MGGMRARCETVKRWVWAVALAGVALAGAAAGGDEGALGAAWQRLEETRLPRVEFVQASARDVLDFLAEGSQMEVRVEPEDALDGAPPLTVDLKGASLCELAQWVGELLGFRVELEETAGGKAGWLFWREGDAGGAKGYLFPRVHLYGIEEGEKKLRWTLWAPRRHGPGEEDPLRNFVIREAGLAWDSEEIGGVVYLLCSFERQLLLEVFEKNADGALEKVDSHSLGELFDLEVGGDITFDGKVEEDGDGVRVVLRRWDATHQGEPEIRRVPKWRGRGAGDGTDGRDGTHGTHGTEGPDEADGMGEGGA